MAELIQPDDASDINSIEDAEHCLVAYRRAARSLREIRICVEAMKKSREMGKVAAAH